MAARFHRFAFVALVVSAVATANAGAYTRTCGAPGVWDPDVCERAEAAAASAATSAEYSQTLAVGVWFLYGAVIMLIAAPMMSAAFRWWRA